MEVKGFTVTSLKPLKTNTETWQPRGNEGWGELERVMQIVGKSRRIKDCDISSLSSQYE